MQGRLARLLALLLLGAAAAHSQPPAPPQSIVAAPNSAQVASPLPREAYATFVVGDSFVLGARVLGQSLRESGTTRALVCLVGGPLAQARLRELRAAGWSLRRVAAVANPGRGDAAAFGSAGHPPKLAHVYGKLAVFNMTEFERVVFLDADTLVMRNADALFRCHGALCAALRHSERFNSGVLVLRPSAVTAANISALAAVLPSYTGGDQGFLNVFFAGLPGSPLFDPEGAAKADAGVDSEALWRLPTAFNADVGLYVLNGDRWPLPEASLRVLHFTLGPLKPWQWWTPWLIPAASQWQDVRRRTPAGAGAADAAAAALAHAVRLTAPMLALGPARRRWRLLLLRTNAPWGSAAAAARALSAAAAAASTAQALRQHRRGAFCRLLPSLLAASAPGAPPPALTWLALAAALPGGVACVLLAALVPSVSTPPRLGWTIFHLWTAALFSLVLGAVLECAHACGRASAPAAATTVAHGSEAASAAVRATARCAVFFGAAFALAPWAPRALGLRGLIAPLAALAGATCVAAAAAAIAAPRLAIAWFAAGAAAAAGAPAEDATELTWSASAKAAHASV